MKKPRRSVSVRKRSYEHLQAHAEALGVSCSSIVEQWIAALGEPPERARKPAPAPPRVRPRVAPERAPRPRPPVGSVPRAELPARAKVAQPSAPSKVAVGKRAPERLW